MPWTRGPLAYAAALPRPRRPARLPEIFEPDGPVRGTAVLMTGCVADTLFGDTNHATAALLRRAGLRVVVPPEQGCCGALPLHLGDRDRAAALARQLATTLAATGAEWVVSNAAGCGALLREYRHLLPDDPAAATVAQRARDALALLAEVGLPPARTRLDCTIAVHDPCHLAHGQGVRAEVRTLLAAVPGVRLVDLEESEICCGSAGTYNLTEPAMARRLLERKLGHVLASGAQVVAAANPGCLLQMRAGALARGLPVAVEHPVDLLARAHGL
jgi:glycolate oxidase iron-sulfur subunit